MIKIPLKVHIANGSAIHSSLCSFIAVDELKCFVFWRTTQGPSRESIGHYPESFCLCFHAATHLGNQVNYMGVKLDLSIFFDHYIRTITAQVISG